MNISLVPKSPNFCKMKIHNPSVERIGTEDKLFTLKLPELFTLLDSKTEADQSLLNSLSQDDREPLAAVVGLWEEASQLA